MSEITRDSLLAALRCHIGASNGATVTRLVAEISGSNAPNPIAERLVRRLVVELRLEGQHVCALPGSGYFIASSSDELSATCEHLYQRALTSLTQIARMRRVSDPDLRGQLHLKT